MAIRPILSSLLKHKIAAALIVVEIALAFAIVSNALYMVIGRLQRIDMPSGIAARELVVLRLATSAKGQGSIASAQTDLAALRAIPGVKSATVINTMPLSHSQWGLSYSTHARQTNFSGGVPSPVVFGGPGLLRTLGVRVLRGNRFRPDAYTDLTPENMFKAFASPRQALITSALAKRLWPNSNAVGKQMYMGKIPVLVIGVVSNFIRPFITTDAHDPSNYFEVISPLRAGPELNVRYVLRCQPARCHGVLAAAAAKLQALHPTETLTNHQSFLQIRRSYFANDRSMAWLLLSAIVALLLITAFGIVGLASFWVQQRTRQIGIRRALGARAVDILRHFQTENLLLSSTGIVIGCLAALAINLWLMTRYQIPRLPLFYLPVGALVLWGLGQVAVLGPALRAASLPPATAVRTS